MNVTELIKYLKTLNGDLPVGAKGDYGVFTPMNKHNFYVCMAYEQTPGHFGSDNIPDEISMLEVSMPDVFRLGDGD